LQGTTTTTTSKPAAAGSLRWSGCALVEACGRALHLHWLLPRLLGLLLLAAGRLACCS
jgi:hypothetical protein